MSIEIIRKVRRKCDGCGKRFKGKTAKSQGLSSAGRLRFGQRGKAYDLCNNCKRVALKQYLNAAKNL